MAPLPEVQKTPLCSQFVRYDSFESSRTLQNQSIRLTKKSTGYPHSTWLCASAIPSKSTMPSAFFRSKWMSIQSLFTVNLRFPRRLPSSEIAKPVHHPNAKATPKHYSVIEGKISTNPFHMNGLILAQSNVTVGKLAPYAHIWTKYETGGDTTSYGLWLDRNCFCIETNFTKL